MLIILPLQTKLLFIYLFGNSLIIIFPLLTNLIKFLIFLRLWNSSYSQLKAYLMLYIN